MWCPVAGAVAPIVEMEELRVQNKLQAKGAEEITKGSLSSSNGSS